MSDADGSPGTPDTATGPVSGGRPPADPVAVAAITIGSLGVILFGIVAALVTGILAAETGRRAREAGRSQENAYLAMGLAAVDGVFWIFLHYRFDLPIWAG